LLYALPGILGAFGILLLPESPKFLLAMRKEAQAMEVIKWMYCKSKGRLNENFAIESLRPEENIFCPNSASKEM
jgi:hypothetical protein